MKKPNPATEVAKQNASSLVELRAKWATDLGLGSNPTANFGAPISFTAHLAAITPGQTQVLSTSGLANGFRTPYLIDEIRMQAYMTSPAADSNSAIYPGNAISFQFRTGNYAFSLVPVPMILHQPAYNSRTYVLESNFTASAIRTGDEARWLLPKPLWMAPGDQIQCNVLRDLTIGSINNATLDVDVTYVGRSLKPGTKGPKTRFVPWIAHYTHDFANAFSQTTTQFRNPFTYPLTIQRLIGRPLSKSTNGSQTTASQNMMPFSTVAYAGIYIEDSAGYKITRSAINGLFTPVGAVFGQERCAWTFARPLGGREQLNMQFQTLGTTQSTNVLFSVAMHSYREEKA